MRHTLVIAAICAAALVSACGDSGGGSPGSTDMAISEDSTYNAHVLVGQIYTTDFDVKNVGKVDIPKLEVMFDATDKFLDHNVIVKSAPCTIDKSLPGLVCGKLALGAELKFSITYQPKDAGNFKFIYRIANDGLYLPEADGTTYDYSWTVAVLS
jgi:hypothetical protein